MEKIAIKDLNENQRKALKKVKVAFNLEAEEVFFLDSLDTEPVIAEIYAPDNTIFRFYIHTDGETYATHRGMDRGCIWTEKVQIEESVKMKKNYALWEKEFGTLLLNLEDIEERINLFDQTVIITSLDPEAVDLETLTEDFLLYLERNKIEIVDTDILETYLGKDSNCSYAEDIEEPLDLVAWDSYNNEFMNLQDYDTVKVYQHLDEGSNWQDIILTEWDDETLVEVDEDSETSLDIWDGNNWYTGNVFNHQDFYKVITKNTLEVEDMYLLVDYDQYQGSHTWGTLMTEDELVKHIEDLGDRADYFEK